MSIGWWSLVVVVGLILMICVGCFTWLVCEEMRSKEEKDDEEVGAEEAQDELYRRVDVKED